MRILLVAIDTRGGVEPYRALAAALGRAGQDVVIAAPSDLTAAGEDAVRSIALPGSMRDAVERLGSTERVSRAPAALRQELRTRTTGAVAAILRAGTDWDLVLAGVGGATVGEAIACAVGAQFLSVPLQPIGPPTQRWPGVLAPAALQSPGLRRALGHAVSTRLVGLPAAGTRTAAFAAAGLTAATPLRRLAGAVYGFSEIVIARPPEWPSEYRVAGYWRDPDAEPPLGPALTAFLDANEPPVVVGFGSMRARHPDRLAAIAVRAAASIGSPLVLLQGWGGDLDPPPSPVPVLVAAEAPHHRLYSRARIAVHHGGAGTTGASLTAGVPTVTVPFAADQPFWGRRVQELGAGPAPVPVGRLSDHRLVAALQTASTSHVQKAAADLGRRLRAEDGLSTAVRAILEQVGPHR